MIPMKFNRLFFVRHGETDWNAEGRMQGQQDIAMNARGHDQAAQAGKTIRNLIGVNPARIAADYEFIASPLHRTRQTMEILRHQLGLPIQSYTQDDRLKEITFGQWEGLTWPEVMARDPQKADERQDNKWGFVPPQGESYAMVAERVRPWFETLEGDAVIVSHGGVARVFLALIGGVDPLLAPNMDIWQGRVLVFQHATYKWL